MEFADRTSEFSSLLTEIPTKLNILLVDSDLVTILTTRTNMQQCDHEVMVYSDAEEARRFLATTDQKIDIVVWDFHMPKINGLEALKIGSSMDLPVVIISDDHQKESVLQATLHGACDYLMKPVRKEVVQTMWQHIVRKRMMSKPGSNQHVQSDLVQNHGLGQENDNFKTITWSEEIEHVQSDMFQFSDVLDLENYDFLKAVDHENVEQNIGNGEANAAERVQMTSTSLIQPVQQDLAQPVQQDLIQTDGLYQDNGEQNITKEGKKPRKPRMTWTTTLHEKFIQAIDIIGGIEKANPMSVLKCLKEMKVEGLTRNNVASHLQKHRINLDETRIPQQTLSIGRSNAYRASSSLLVPHNDQFGRSNAFQPSSLIAPSNVPLLSPTNAYSSIPRLVNERAYNPMMNQNQYPNGHLPMNNNQLMTNPLPCFPYFNHPPQQQQQQQHPQYQFSHQMDYAMKNKEPEQYQFPHHLQPQYQQQYEFPHRVDNVTNKKEPEQTYGNDHEVNYPNITYDPNDYWMNEFSFNQ